MIPFTQYLRPDGERRAVEIDRSTEIEAMAKAFIAQGGYFECEELTAGHVSFTAGHPDAEEGDIAIVVVMNGPDVPEAVDRLVAKAFSRFKERNNSPCTCRWSSVNTATIDPPEITKIDPDCPHHGHEAVPEPDPDEALQRKRDDAWQMPPTEEDQ